MIRDGSKSFHLASLLLPERVREPARSLYAFCRVADDLVDKSDDPAAAVHQLEDRIERIYAGRPSAHAADRAFADVAERHALPRALPAALIEGFAWDAAGRSYDDLADVVAYAVRVAGTVGAMMSLIMGARDPAAIARACDLGVAMQLTNIARDVGEDAANGRIYLPLSWLREAGIVPDEFKKAPGRSAALTGIVNRLLGEAEQLYRRATAGFALLPASCRPAIHASQLLYAEIGREIRKPGFDFISRRAIVGPRRKLLLLGAACTALLPQGRGDLRTVLPQAEFLVDAVMHMPAPPPRRQGLDQRAAFVVDLFMRLESQRT